jgi:hypothetical protein
MHAFRRCAAFATAGAVLALAAMPGRAAEPVLLQPGTYGQYNPGTKKIAVPGNQVVIVRGKGGKLAFSLNAVRGVDVNQGYVAGMLPPPNGRSVVWIQQAEGANCKLTFTPIAGGLMVAQDAKFGDCGFGYGVYADGQYVRLADAKMLGAPPDSTNRTGP